MADVIVTGYAVRFPLVGMVLAFAHYVAGLERLGHRVIYLEESGWDHSCYNPTTGEHSEDPSYGISVVRGVLDRLGAVATPVCYFDRSTGTWHGTSEAEMTGALDGCDLLLNLGGVCQLDEFERCSTTALVDMDPGFTQAGRFGAPYLSSYDVLFTYGTNINNPTSSIPEVAGLRWHPTVPPVIVDYWQQRRGSLAIGRASRDQPLVFSTVASLDAYGAIDVDGRSYGQKAAELERLGDAPRLLAVATDDTTRLELALAGGDEDDRRRLIECGWTVTDAQAASLEPDRYEEYLVQSAGEFSVAKEAYVGLRTGWFSDRTVCYLALGKPVIVQDTGFDVTRFSGPDGGLMMWRTPGEAIDAVVDVVGDYDRHEAAARKWADEVFGHNVVLSELLDVALAGHRSTPPR